MDIDCDLFTSNNFLFNENDSLFNNITNKDNNNNKSCDLNILVEKNNYNNKVGEDTQNNNKTNININNSDNKEKLNACNNNKEKTCLNKQSSKLANIQDSINAQNKKKDMFEVRKYDKEMNKLKAKLKEDKKDVLKEIENYTYNHKLEKVEKINKKQKYNNNKSTYYNKQITNELKNIKESESKPCYINNNKLTNEVKNNPYKSKEIINEFMVMTKGKMKQINSYNNNNLSRSSDNMCNQTNKNNYNLRHKKKIDYNINNTFKTALKCNYNNNSDNNKTSKFKNLNVSQTSVYNKSYDKNESRHYSNAYRNSTNKSKLTYNNYNNNKRCNNTSTYSNNNNNYSYNKYSKSLLDNSVNQLNRNKNQNNYLNKIDVSPIRSKYSNNNYKNTEDNISDEINQQIKNLNANELLNKIEYTKKKLKLYVEKFKEKFLSFDFENISTDISTLVTNLKSNNITKINNYNKQNKINIDNINNNNNKNDILKNKRSIKNKNKLETKNHNKSIQEVRSTEDINYSPNFGNKHIETINNNNTSLISLNLNEDKVNKRNSNKSKNINKAKINKIKKEINKEEVTKNLDILSKVSEFPKNLLNLKSPSTVSINVDINSLNKKYDNSSNKNLIKNKKLDKSKVSNKTNNSINLNNKSNLVDKSILSNLNNKKNKNKFDPNTLPFYNKVVEISNSSLDVFGKMNAYISLFPEYNKEIKKVYNRWNYNTTNNVNYKNKIKTKLDKYNIKFIEDNHGVDIAFFKSNKKDKK